MVAERCLSNFYLATHFFYLLFIYLVNILTRVCIFNRSVNQMRYEEFEDLNFKSSTCILSDDFIVLAEIIIFLN